MERIKKYLKSKDPITIKLADIPIADWVIKLSEGKAEYIRPKQRFALRTEYMNNKNKAILSWLP
jgi:hypothetical protein